MAGLSYMVDIIMCIDATGSMSHAIDMVKDNALRFESDLAGQMAKKQKQIDQLRVKVVVFRDIFADPADAMLESEFFSLPQDREAFSSFVRSVRASGGGDEPESSLEALALAMRSNWTKSGDKRRHVVVLWTDASAHRLEDSSARGYPPQLQHLPGTFSELTALWEGQEMDQAAKRLLVYAPDAYPWPEIQNSWESVVHVASKAGEGLSEVDYAAVLEAIANSV
jgi:hypothetical protein